MIKSFLLSMLCVKYGYTNDMVMKIGSTSRLILILKNIYFYRYLKLKSLGQEYHLLVMIHVDDLYIDWKQMILCIHSFPCNILMRGIISPFGRRETKMLYHKYMHLGEQ